MSETTHGDNDLGAFPGYVPQYTEKFGTGGMTLRDYFAASVLRGMSQWRSLVSVESQEEVASLCYSMADAMMKARKKTP